jgi:putative ABC transport system permease protein
VQPAAFATRPDLKITSGPQVRVGQERDPRRRGRRKAFAARRRLASQWGQNEWTVVGTFSADGAVWESEIWTDARVLQPAYRRGNSFQTVVARLDSPSAFDKFKDALTKDPRLDVQVQRESEYFGNQGRRSSRSSASSASSSPILMGSAPSSARSTRCTRRSRHARARSDAPRAGLRPGAVGRLGHGGVDVLATVGGVIGAVLAWAFLDGLSHLDPQTSTRSAR